MNRLKAGAVLSVPSPSRPSAVTTAEARQVIHAQSADFGAYRQRLAGGVPTTKADDSRRQAKRQGAGRTVDDTSRPPRPRPTS